MAFESITDERIQQLLAVNKQVINPGIRTKVKDGHEQQTYSVVSADGNEKFELYTRQNKREGMEDDFSCGIAWKSASGELLTLCRYNGSSHPHMNKLEKVKLPINYHIHKATERHIKSGLKAEGYAEVSTKYKTLSGALHCLVSDCKISGLVTQPDDSTQLNIFD